MLLKPITITIFVSQQAHQETNIKYLQQMVLAPGMTGNGVKQKQLLNFSSHEL